jgi:hypothetical protein
MKADLSTSGAGSWADEKLLSRRTTGCAPSGGAEPQACWRELMRDVSAPARLSMGNVCTAHYATQAGRGTCEHHRWQTVSTAVRRPLSTSVRLSHLRNQADPVRGELEPTSSITPSRSRRWRCLRRVRISRWSPGIPVALYVANVRPWVPRWQNTTEDLLDSGSAARGIIGRLGLEEG